MVVFALWHGGSSYSPGSIENGDLEKFDTIAQARETFRDRAETSGGWPLPTYFVDRENNGTRFPAVDEKTSMDVYTYDPRAAGDPYPNFRFILGPRGGVRRENY
jgi:hypothetical protein